MSTGCGILRDRLSVQTADQSQSPDESSAVALSFADPSLGQEVSHTQAVQHIMTSSVLAAGSERVS